jgi:hypothetical protein
MGEVVQASEPALSTLAQTLLGALLIIAVLIALAAIYALFRVQNARVADQKEMIDRLDTANSKMAGVLTKFTNTLGNLEEAEKEDTKATYAMRDEVNRLATKIEYCPVRRGG